MTHATLPRILQRFSKLAWVSAAAVAPLSAQLSEAFLPGDTEVAPLFGQQLRARIAESDNAMLAVWLDYRATLEPTVEIDPWNVTQTEIFAARLAADGTPIDTVPIQIDGSPYAQGDHAVASNGSDWIIVYESRSVSSTGFYTTQDVRAVRVSAAGEVLDATPLVIEVSDSEGYVPAAASDGTNFAVFWVDGGTTWGRLIGPDGTVGAAIPVVQNEGWHFNPSVAFAGDRYLLTWDGPGVRGQLLDTNLQPIGGKFQIGNGTRPRVATDGTDFYVTVSDLGTWAEIRGTVVRNDGTVVDPGGLLLDGQSYLALEPADVAWNGTAYSVAWTESKYEFPDGPKAMLRANHVDSDGELLHPAPLALIDTFDYSVREPVLGSMGGEETFVGWLETRLSTQGHYDGFGTTLDTTGATGSTVSFTVGQPAQFAPDLVSGPTGATLDDDVLLAVFLSAVSGETRVVAQRVTGSGAPIDLEPIVVAGDSDRFVNPGAAWNGEHWLVIWEDAQGGFVLGARVGVDGSLLDAAPIELLEGDEPAVAALDVVGGDFLVAASKLTSSDIRTMYGIRVAPDGQLLDPAPFLLGGNFAQSVSVGGFDDRWFAVWHRKPTHDTPSSYLVARFVMADGTLGSILDPSNSTTDELTPDVVVGGDLATFVWSDGDDIRLRQVQKDGTLLGSNAGLVVNAAPEEQKAPTVCADESKLVVTWVDDRIHGTFEPGVGDLFGARLDSMLTVLEPDGVALVADPNVPEGESGMAGRSGVSLVLVPALDASVGQWRVSLGAWRDWESMGGSLPGSTSPRLEALGLLTGGSTVTMRVRQAPDAAPGLLLVGTSSVNLPLLGGTLVPDPQTVLPVVTDATGAIDFVTLLGAGLPAGTNVFSQAWFVDASAPFGACATDAAHGTAP